MTKIKDIGIFIAIIIVLLGLELLWAVYIWPI